ncbi:MAG: RidA family protein [Mangrovibacterium sp.]
MNGIRVGTRYEDENAEYCFLGDIFPVDKNLSPSGQTLQTLENIRKALISIGMSFSQVVRTWFYLDKLYDWYSEFNEIRTTFYREQGVFDNLIPVSTGIGASNLHGTHLVANVLAVKPKHPGVHILSVPSPLQCEATEYKSSFSRAVEIRFPTHRQLYISGTASIDRNGNSIHEGNINSQIDATMKVVQQIIESRSMNWCDAVRAIAYFKDINHVSEFCDYCQKNHIPSFPVCYCQSDICRPELLFEIEIDLIGF